MPFLFVNGVFGLGVVVVGVASFVALDSARNRFAAVRSTFTSSNPGRRPTLRFVRRLLVRVVRLNVHPLHFHYTIAYLQGGCQANMYSRRGSFTITSSSSSSKFSTGSFFSLFGFVVVVGGPVERASRERMTIQQCTRIQRRPFEECRQRLLSIRRL